MVDKPEEKKMQCMVNQPPCQKSFRHRDLKTESCEWTKPKCQGIETWNYCTFQAIKAIHKVLEENDRRIRWDLRTDLKQNFFFFFLKICQCFKCDSCLQTFFF